MEKTEPEVKIIKYNHFGHSDLRRKIIGLSGKLKIDLKFEQMKVILVNDYSVKNSSIIGNHLHKKSSDQWEFIYTLNENNQKNLFEFRFKNYDQPIQTKYLKSGDCAIVPPGCALGLKPIFNNSIIIEISNKIYHDNYINVELF